MVSKMETSSSFTHALPGSLPGTSERLQHPSRSATRRIKEQDTRTLMEQWGKASKPQLRRRIVSLEKEWDIERKCNPADEPASCMHVCASVAHVQG